MIYWNQVHFVVVYKIKGDKVFIADPAKGKVTYTKEEFLQNWLNTKNKGQSTGIALLLYTSPSFYDLEGETGNRLSFGILFRYILPYKNLLFQLGLGLLAGSILQLIVPFLTQAVVDIGIQNRDINFIYLILMAQLMLFCGPCKNELEQAKELLSIYPGQVSLSLRFLKSGDDGETSGLLLKSWLQKLRERSNGLPEGQTLIETWYEVMDAEKFADLHPVNGEISDTEAEEYLRAHYNWIKQAGITKTPTTFMNGYELPSAYMVKDLFALIPGLVDVFGNQNGINKANISSGNAKISE